METAANTKIDELMMMAANLKNRSLSFLTRDRMLNRTPRIVLAMNVSIIRIHSNSWLSSSPGDTIAFTQRAVKVSSTNSAQAKDNFENRVGFLP